MERGYTLEEVSPCIVRELANEIFDEDQISVAALGPLDPKTFADVAAMH